MGILTDAALLIPTRGPSRVTSETNSIALNLNTQTPCHLRTHPAVFLLVCTQTPRKSLAQKQANDSGDKTLTIVKMESQTFKAARCPGMCEHTFQLFTQNLKNLIKARRIQIARGTCTHDNQFPGCPGSPLGLPFSRLTEPGIYLHSGQPFYSLPMNLCLISKIVLDHMDCDSSVQQSVDTAALKSVARL